MIINNQVGFELTRIEIILIWLLYLALFTNEEFKNKIIS